MLHKAASRHVWRQGNGACRASLLKSCQDFATDRPKKKGYLTGANRLHNIRSMLKHGLEEQQLIANERQDPLQDIRHDNVHGEHYFH